MQVRERPSTGRVLKNWQRWPMAVCLGSALAVSADPLGAGPAATVIAPAVQAARDDERLRILREELQRTEALAAQLAQRKAERLAVADAAGADEAEAQRTRALQDIASLEREIAGLRPAAGASKRPPSAASGQPASTRPPVHSPPSAPWWDVYGRTRRGDAPAPVSYASPSGGAADAAPSSTYRME